MKILAGQNRLAATSGLVCYAAVILTAGRAHPQTTRLDGVCDRRFWFRSSFNDETFGAVECFSVSTNHLISVDQHSASGPKRATVPAVCAAATQRTVVQLRFRRHVIDTDIAVPPPTFGRLNEPVILPLAESHARPETTPAAVPHEQSVEFRQRVAVLIW